MIRLFAYLIGGQAVGRDIPSWGTADLGGNQPFIASEEESLAGYEDISSITAWATFGSSAGKDYKYLRARVYMATATKGWANTDLEEKKAACKYFASGVGAEFNNGEAIWTDEEQREFLEQFRTEMGASRAARDRVAGKYMMEMIFRGYATQQSMEDMIMEIKFLRGLFLSDGVEGTQWGDSYDGLFDYLSNTSSFVPFEITAVDQGNKKFTVSGDATATKEAYSGMDLTYMRVRESTGNDGKYTITNKSLVGGGTEITVSESIPDSTADGAAYTVGFMRRACATADRLEELMDIYVNGNY
jgi:hypothetical protein